MTLIKLKLAKLIAASCVPRSNTTRSTTRSTTNPTTPASFFASLLVLLWLPASASAAGAADAPTAPNAPAARQEKVLRVSFRSAETGFDPAQISDLYSRTIARNIFEALYNFDYLARPSKVVPDTAEALPVISDNFKTFIVKIKPGIFFADDPAFCDKDGKSCKKRELTAQDYVYSYKRIMDPKTRGPTASGIEELNLIGLNELRKAADKPGGNFDYVKEIEGLRTLDRYTLQFKTSEPQPRLIYSMADGSVVGAVAREVVEKYGDKIMEHPVGTGPYKLDKWTRSSKIVLVRSPNFREQIFSAVPPADDVRALAIAAHLKGKRLPLIDRVEVSIIEEEQPRWLAFLGNEHDFYERLAPTFAYTAIPNNRLAPNLAKRGIEMERTTASDITIHYFNMQDPIVGGYTPEKVALRRAMSLGFNVGEEIRLPFRNQAVLAQSPFAPATFGYDPAFKTAMSEYDPLKAKALLDMYGYVDKDGDGWRDMPDGKPLVVEYATEPTGFQRERIEIWRKSMDAIGIKMIFKPAKWPENLKSARAGKLQMWGLANSASIPDSSDFLQLAYGPSAGQQNFPRFLNAEFDALYDQQKILPDGPERLAVMQKAAKIWTAYMPIKVASHRVLTDMWHPWAIGYMRHPVANGLFWRFMDIDLSKLPPQ